MDDLTQDWRKSSYSGGSGSANCVEVAKTTRAVLVRDTRDPDGTTLTLSGNTWQEFLARL